MKNVLVTGGAGYIGSHTVVELCDQGYHPIIVDDLRNSSKDVLAGLTRLIPDGFTFYSVDICDKDLFFGVFSEHNIDAIIHFAAYKSVGDSCAHPLEYYQNNLIGLMNVMEACAFFGIKKLVFSSSCTVYGEPDIKEVRETTAKKLPVSPYGFTKWMGEQILEDYSKTKPNLQIICLRYFNPIGAHPSAQIGELPNGTPNNLLPYITQTAMGLQEKLTVFGNDYPTSDGTCVRDYIHVCDVADAHVVALNYAGKKYTSLYHFNIGTGKGTSVLEVVAFFQKTTHMPLSFEIGDRRSGDVVEIYANVDLAKTELKWSAKRSVESAIADAWEWEKSRNAAK
jgi:UDP-glucose 4-epimerase